MSTTLLSRNGDTRTLASIPPHIYWLSLLEAFFAVTIVHAACTLLQSLYRIYTLTPTPAASSEALLADEISCSDSADDDDLQPSPSAGLATSPVDHPHGLGRRKPASGRTITMAALPILEEYDVSPTLGFLPTDPPVTSLADAYYKPWEYIVENLQGLILSKRLRGAVDRLPTLSTARLSSEAEWRRAYVALAFISHAYIWGGNRPAERVPPPIAIPFLATCKHLELPPVATYAGVCLWNWKPIFDSERVDTLSNLDIINTFTGSLDEKWFYLISVAIEAKGGPLVPLMLDAIQAAGRGDRPGVTRRLQAFAERLDDIASTLTRMYDDCDPHIFYHRIRPYLAGSKNMADAGLPNGVIFDNGGPINRQRYVQLSGGSNAQSSLIQFFDLVLGVEHHPTRSRDDNTPKPAAIPGEPKPKKVDTNFILDMRRYMPGKHARFLARVAEIANLRAFVAVHRHDDELRVAYDACLAMLSALRDKHIQIVSRYIVIKAREAERAKRGSPGGLSSPQLAVPKSAGAKLNLAARPKTRADARPADDDDPKAGLKGTGGSSLIPFLRQARDETGEPVIGEWARRLLDKRTGPLKAASTDDVTRIKSLEQTAAWGVDNSTGGLCVY